MTPETGGHMLENENMFYLSHDVETLCAAARAKRDASFGRVVTYSPKVFLPVTNLCRNHCEYCAFRRSPNEPGAWTMSPAEVDTTLRAGRERGCTEALLCLGDTPETSFASYRETLAGYGQASTVDYLDACSRVALAHGLLPHTNAGLLAQRDLERLAETNVSLGLMLETVSDRLSERGGPHGRAPDKRPAARLRMLCDAGELGVPFTTGVLVGIGETFEEYLATLDAILGLHLRFGHIQEVIIQPFRAHPGTRMQTHPEPDLVTMRRAIAVARLTLPEDVSVQTPPNLSEGDVPDLLDAGADDLGGISPVTRDYINPDHAWPHLAALGAALAERGYRLRARLPVTTRQRSNVRPHLRAFVEAAQVSLDDAGAVLAQRAGGGASCATVGSEAPSRGGISRRRD